MNPGNNGSQAGGRIMLTGGGTAGHIYPALAVFNRLRQMRPSIEARWVGSERIESKIVPQAGIDFHQIDIRFSWRRPTLENFDYYRRHIWPIIMGRPFRQALGAVEAFNPDLVLATGGYVAAPVIWAAIRRGIPVALIELNNPPGLVNWHFSESAWRIYVGYRSIAGGFVGRCPDSKLFHFGYPVRKPQRNRAQVCREYGIDPHRRILLTMGGSLGAGVIHHAVHDLLWAAANSRDPRWADLALLNVGGERAQLMYGALDESDLPSGPVQYRSVGYMEDSVGAMMASDFYLGRSGAATTGELWACGLPSLLIPDPQHGDNQQMYNAEHLVRRGQGAILDQSDVTGEAIIGWLSKVWDREKLPQPEQPSAELIAEDLTCLWES